MDSGPSILGLSTRPLDRWDFGWHYWSMADTKALRSRILNRIAVLNQRLKALDLVDEMERELGDEDGGTPDSGAPILKDGSLIKVCLDVLPEQWRTVSAQVPVVQQRYPMAKRPAISTAYKRLAERKLVEVRGGKSRKDPLEYKRKDFF